MISRFFVLSFVILAGCNQDSEGFFLDCEGKVTYNAMTDTLVEPYREIFFVDEVEMEVLKDSEFGIPLCDVRHFGDDRISCRNTFEDRSYVAIENITINRVSGQLTILTEEFNENLLVGSIQTQASCSRSQSRPENKL